MGCDGLFSGVEVGRKTAVKHCGDGTALSNGLMGWHAR
jgi:hypothetical protein